jgi:hypothetical protein
MKKNLYKLYLVILILIPIVLLILPADFFDKGKSICLSIFLFDIECYACGLTRAIQHLIHFDFSIGYEYNRLSILVLPFLIVSYYGEIKRVINIL